MFSGFVSTPVGPDWAEKTRGDGAGEGEARVEGPMGVAAGEVVVEGGMGSSCPKKPCVDKESLVSVLRYIGLPHSHTCQPAAGGAPSIILPSS